MAYDRRTGIDLEAVRDLAARWNHLGDELERRRGDMYNSVSVIPWNGRAGNAMRDLWGTGRMAAMPAPLTTFSRRPVMPLTG